MTFDEFLAARGITRRLVNNETDSYGYFDANGNPVDPNLLRNDAGRDAFLPGEQTYNLANLYQQSQSPTQDQAGNNPWGTMGGLFGGMATTSDRQGMTADSPYTTINGKRVARTGMSYTDLNRALNAYGAQTDLPENLGGYDQTIGYYYDADTYDKAKAAKDQQFSKQNSGFDMFAFGPLLVGAGWGAMIAAAAAGAGAAGLGASGGFGEGLGAELAYGAPELAGSYGLPAGATIGGGAGSDALIGGEAADTLGGGAVDVPGAGFDFSSSYLPTGSPSSVFSGGGGGFSPVTVGSGVPLTGGAPISSGVSISDILGGLKSASSVGQLVSGLSGLGNAFSSYKAGNQAADAAKYAADTQLGIFNTINNQQAPYRGAGYAALSSILGGANLGPQVGGVPQGYFTHQFDKNDLNTNLAPNYQFQLEQGQGAIRNAMNASSGLMSGNTLKGISDYTINKAGDAYQQAFGNYNAQRSNIFNTLASIAGYGQQANQTSATAGASLGNSAGTNIANAGAAQAAGTVGVGNALTGAANNAMGWYTLPNILNAYSGSANA